MQQAVLMILLACALPGAGCLNAQVAVKVTVVDGAQQPLPRSTVRLTELGTAQHREAATDNSGQASISIPGGEWRLTVNGHDPGQEPLLVQDGEQGQAEFFITYNPARDARKRRQSFNRSGYTEEPSPARLPEVPRAGWNLVEIQVTGSDGRRLSGRRVALVNTAEKKRHTAVSGSDGIARFHLPGKTPYDIDVEEQLNAAHLVLEDRVGYTLEQTVVYDAYDLQENRRGDTITQSLKLPVTQKASRALYRITIRKQHQPWANGNVYLDATGSKDVYRARTDGSGTAVFILPFGKRYLVHLPYQRDVEVINLLEARQEASGSTELDYVPDPALEFPERYLPTPDRLTLTHFRYYHKLPYPAGEPKKPAFPAAVRDGETGAVLHFGMGGNTGGGRQRTALNVAFVLDVSASMAGDDRLESLKRGLLRLLAQLRPDDRVALITFDDRQRLLLPSQALGSDRNRIAGIIESIQPGGGTDMLEALRTGYREVARHRTAAADNRVVLLSDGFDSNPTDTLLAAQRQWRDQIPCMAIGVGSGYNAELLERLSNHTALRQAHEGAELERLFSETILNAQPVASGIEVRIRLDEGLTCTSVYGLDSLVQSRNTISGRLPALYSANDLPCMAVLQPKDKSALKESYPVLLTYRYRNHLTGQPEETTLALDVRFGSAGPASPEEAKMLRVAQANDCLMRMAMAVAKGEIAAARKAQQEGLRLFAAPRTTGSDKDLDALQAQLKSYETPLRNAEKKAALK